jgi:hypothetical protein
VPGHDYLLSMLFLLFFDIILASFFLLVDLGKFFKDILQIFGESDDIFSVFDGPFLAV